jgi:hypothetical protein
MPARHIHNSKTLLGSTTTSLWLSAMSDPLAQPLLANQPKHHDAAVRRSSASFEISKSNSTCLEPPPLRRQNACNDLNLNPAEATTIIEGANAPCLIDAAL